jgi:hypothetical protein
MISEFRAARGRFDHNQAGKNGRKIEAAKALLARSRANTIFSFPISALR